MDIDKMTSKKQDNKHDTVTNLPAAGADAPTLADENILTPSRLMGVVVRVENLNVARAFYRDILELGAPIMDSTFWVEFKLGDSAALVLEQARPGEKLVSTKGRVAWVCETPDIDELVDRLQELGHVPLPGETDKIGFKVLKYQDPEGNPFYLKSAK